MNFEINKHVLLTGSGFTKNFGGFLANEMWSWIFNNSTIRKCHKLSNLLKNDFDYESIYYKVIESSEFGDNEKKAIYDAIYNAYEKLDDKIKDYKSLDTSQTVSIAAVNKFIERFSGYSANTGSNDTKGFFFTLNQDLFIERYCNPPNFKPITLYISQQNLSQDEKYDEKTHSVNAATYLGKNNSLSSSKFFYVKLHGSWNWYRDSSDGMKKLVIGKNKINQINDEPVLARYFDIFKEVLSKGDVRLFVIGYGFGDEHINEAIADAVEQNSLKLYVINPVDPAEFKDDLCKKPFGQTLFRGLIGYYPFDLSTVFPGNETVEYKSIQDNYFNDC